MDEEKTAPRSNEAEAEAKQTAPTIADRKDKKKKHRGFLIAGLCVALMAVVCVGICVIAANMQTVFRGVSVLDVDMGGMTREQAEKIWADRADAIYEQPRIALKLDEETICMLSLKELGASASEAEAAATAWDACHSGRFFTDGYHLAYSWFAPRPLMPRHLDVEQTVLQTAVEDRISCMDFTVVDGAYALMEDGSDGMGLYITRPRDGKLVDTDKLAETLYEHLSSGELHDVACDYRQQTAAQIDVQRIYDELHGPMQNAEYDRATGGPSRSHIGVEFDVAAVQAQLDTQPDGSTFLADAKVEFPEVSTEELEKCMFRDVLGTYTTKVTGSWARIGNVKLASQMCDERVYNPGEEFWYNATVGKRTVERGFGEAPAYLRGQTVMEVGGGICQVSSTLYYATLLANLRIVQRYAHQFAPGYITWGCDATVSWNGPDFAFANNTAYPIKIVTAWHDNNLTMSVLGTKADDTYVKMESYTRSSTPYQVEYRYNAELTGQEDVTIQTAYTGYLVETYRCVYDGNDELLSRTYEAKSSYDKRDAIIETGDYEKIQRLYQASLEG